MPSGAKNARVCSACNWPTGEGIFVYMAEARMVCSACFSLYEAVCSNPWFIRAQEEYEAAEKERRKKHNQLKPGGNYFPEEY